jgi:hypothetical protein
MRAAAAGLTTADPTCPRCGRPTELIQPTPPRRGRVLALCPECEAVYPARRSGPGWELARSAGPAAAAAV